MEEGGREGRDGGRMPKQAGEEGAGPTEIEAVKNGSGRRSRPMEMCQEGSSINILMKASQALEGPQEQPAFHQPRGLPKTPRLQEISILPVLHCEGVSLPKGVGPKCPAANMLH